MQVDIVRNLNKIVVIPACWADHYRLGSTHAPISTARISFLSPDSRPSLLAVQNNMSETKTITSPPEITADNVATLFPDVDTSLARDVLPSANGNTARQGTELEGYDEEQVRLMDEVCIVLDNDDKPIGSASKKACKSAQSVPGLEGQ